jgi:FkbM family methyltransferase
MVDMKKLLRSALVHAPGLQAARFKAEARWVRMSRRPYQPEFAGLRVLPLTQPLVLDIGCYRGISIETILAMRPDARVIGFDVNSALAAETRRWFAADPRVEIRSMGLGSRASEIDIHVAHYRGYRFDGLASFDPTWGEKLVAKGLLYGFDPRHLRTERFPASIQRLDDLKLAPAVLKVYVEGFEQAVLEGGAETIRAHQPVILAPSNDPGVDAWLRAQGYRRFSWIDGKFVAEADVGLYVYYLGPKTLAGLDSTCVTSSPSS